MGSEKYSGMRRFGPKYSRENFQLCHWEPWLCESHFSEMLQAPRGIAVLESASDAVTGGSPEPSPHPAPQSFKLNRKQQKSENSPGALLSTPFLSTGQSTTKSYRWWLLPMAKFHSLPITHALQTQVWTSEGRLVVWKSQSSSLACQSGPWIQCLIVEKPSRNNPAHPLLRKRKGLEM